MACILIFAGCAGVQTQSKAAFDPNGQYGLWSAQRVCGPRKPLSGRAFPTPVPRWTFCVGHLLRIQRLGTALREATKPAKKCTQLVTTEEWIRTGALDPDSSEDCLYVDIYRPEHPAHSGLLPVYVFIHGGSNNFGFAGDYDGRVLAKLSDVVVVDVQYRLGPLGWFFHPAIQTGGSDQLSDSGNFGTLDQCPGPEMDSEKHPVLRR